MRDLQPLTKDDGEPRLRQPARAFLSDELFGGRDHVIFYDRSLGHSRARRRRRRQDFGRALAGYDAMYGTDYSKVMPRDPGRALQILENYLRMRLSDGKSIALIIDFAETLAPAGDISAPVGGGPLRAGHAGQVGVATRSSSRATCRSC